MSTDDNSDGITPSTPGTNAAPVVVGFDDSPDGCAALLHAWDEARLRGVPLQVVTAFEYPRRSAFAYGISFLPNEAFPSQNPTALTVHSRTRHRVDEVLADQPATGPPVVVSAVAGPPVQILLERAREAALLVVGHRGHGAVTSTLLGSVGRSCVLHASCPVTVVPTAEDDDSRPDQRAPTSRNDEALDRASLSNRS